jgi:hypothetical protein
MLEIHRYLQFGTFDVLPYLQNWAGRKTWWNDHWTKAKNVEGRRIVITTPTVSQEYYVNDPQLHAFVGNSK